jgi:uncharacterized protein involved in exopolysaccharide biosynthesis
MSRFFELMSKTERREAYHSNRIVEPALAMEGEKGNADSHRRLVNSNRSLAAIGLLRWRLILLCTVVCVLLAGLVTLIMPKKYEAEVQFLIKNERPDLTIAPAQNTTSLQTSQLSEAEVNSEMRMLLSHDLLEGVVRDYHLYAPYLRDGVDTPDRRAIELAVMKLNKDLEVTAIRKTNVIQANYRAAYPDLAADVMKDLSRRYLNAHLAAHRTPDSYGFFSSELASQRDGLYKAEIATSEFRRAAQIFNLDQQRTALVAQMEDVNARLQNVEGDIRERRARLAAVTAEDNTASKRIPTEVDQSRTAMQSDDRVDLTTLEARRSALRMMQKAYLADLNKFDKNAVTLANLEQDQEIAQQNYISYSRRFEEARLADQMDKEKFANVVMIETPVASPLSVFPMLAPNLFLGAALGLILGFAIAFIHPLNQGAESRTDGFVNQPLRP